MQSGELSLGRASQISHCRGEPTSLASEVIQPKVSILYSGQEFPQANFQRSFVFRVLYEKY